MSQHTPKCDCGGGQDPAVYHDRPCPMWRLMTAAPELLAALMDILDDAEHSWLTFQGRLEQIKETARAAIRKATED